MICLEHTRDVREAIVHGVLHLLGMDHETDDGEMLALQRELLAAGAATLTRSGFVALAGRPNVGKSTLVNAVVGEKVAIVSDRPQTTRRAIRGVHSSGDCQLVLVDLPGVQRPRDALTDAHGRVACSRSSPAPTPRCSCSTASRGSGRATASSPRRSPSAGRAGDDRRQQGRQALARGDCWRRSQQAAELGVGEERVPDLGAHGSGVPALVEHLAALMPEGPFMFGEQAISDQPQAVLLAELVREAVIRRTFQEVPHAVEVIVEEIEQPAPGPDPRAGADLGRKRLAEGDPDRRARDA